MKFHFKETDARCWPEWFELHLEHLALGIYWPTQSMVTYWLGRSSAINGMDVEAEAVQDIYRLVIEDWPMFAETPGQTRLAISLAVSAVSGRVWEKRLAERDLAPPKWEQVLKEKPKTEDKPKTPGSGEYDPKPFSSL